MARTRPPVELLTREVCCTGSATVGGLENAALVVGTKRRAECRDPDNLGFYSVNDDAANLACLSQAHELPRLAGIGRFVSAATDDHIAAKGGTPCANTDHAGIRFQTSMEPIEPVAISAIADGCPVRHSSPSSRRRRQSRP